MRALSARTSRVMPDESDARNPDEPRAIVDDGAYDAFILWVESMATGALAFDITITTGVQKGTVVALETSASSARTALGTDDAIDLVGLPCTLQVTDGQPVLAPG